MLLEPGELEPVSMLVWFSIHPKYICSVNILCHTFNGDAFKLGNLQGRTIEYLCTNSGEIRDEISQKYMMKFYLKKIEFPNH